MLKCKNNRLPALYLTVAIALFFATNTTSQSIVWQWTYQEPGQSSTVRLLRWSDSKFLLQTSNFIIGSAATTACVNSDHELLWRHVFRPQSDLFTVSGKGISVIDSVIYSWYLVSKGNHNQYIPARVVFDANGRARDTATSTNYSDWTVSSITPPNLLQLQDGSVLVWSKSEFKPSGWTESYTPLYMKKYSASLDTLWYRNYSLDVSTEFLKGILFEDKPSTFALIGIGSLSPSSSILRNSMSKYSSNGITLERINRQDTMYDYYEARSIAPDRFVILGRGPGYTGSYTGLAVVYDSSGPVRAKADLGFACYPTSIAQAGVGGYLIAGTSFEPPDFKSQRWFVQRVDSALHMIWAIRSEPNSNNSIQSIIRLNSNTYITAGRTDSIGVSLMSISDDFTENVQTENVASLDYWCYKYGTELEIRNNSPYDGVVVMTDIMGRLVNTFRLEPNAQQHFDLSFLSRGLYHLWYRSNSGRMWFETLLHD